MNTNCTKCKWKQWRRLVNTSSTNMGMLWSLLTRRPRVIGGNRSIINRGNLTRINIFRQYIDEHPMLLMFSRGFKDIVTKTAFFKEFPGLENKFQNSRGFKEIKDPYEPCSGIRSRDHSIVSRTLYPLSHRAPPHIYRVKPGNPRREGRNLIGKCTQT